MAFFMNKQKGFTIIEMAFVLIIIGIIISGILNAGQIIENSKANDAMTTIKDLQNASALFKNQFSYLPGDWVYTANQIPNVTSSSGDGNGFISANESDGAMTQMFNAGFIRTDKPRTAYGKVSIIETSSSPVSSAGFNPSVKNVIVLENLPCSVALMVDLKIDDGSLTTGQGRSSVTTCTKPNDPISYGFSLD
jgi:prepilin-type N-terminal cleavage/methylation domain-containing protein